MAILSSVHEQQPTKWAVLDLAMFTGDVHCGCLGHRRWQKGQARIPGSVCQSSAWSDSDGTVLLPLELAGLRPQNPIGSHPQVGAVGRWGPVTVVLASSFPHGETSSMTEPF